MKILISEDNLTKLKSLIRFFKNNFPEAELVYVDYAKASIIQLKENSDYDLLIQDMHLPIRSDSRIDTTGGLYVLNQLRRRLIETPVVVFSSEDQRYLLDDNNFNDIRSIVYGSENWINELKQVILDLRSK
jgi:CheY-like chemotaxis protein